MKAHNKFTVSALLAAAAAFIIDNTNEKTGSHPTVLTAITEAASINGFRKEVSVRAVKLFEFLSNNDIAVPKTKKKRNVKTFGKVQSSSQNKYAIANVIKNRDERVNSLLMASKVAEQHHSKWYK
jgi:hypothetical protein